MSPINDFIHERSVSVVLLKGRLGKRPWPMWKTRIEWCIINDIVEVLEVLKWMYHNDIIFCEVLSLQDLEFDLKNQNLIAEVKDHFDVLTKRQVEDSAASLHPPFHKVSVFHCLKFVSHNPYSINPTAAIVADSIHCKPARFNRYGTQIPGRFDTAMVNVANGRRVGVKGQICCVFVLPSKAQKAWFPGRGSALHLAYMDTTF
ncbi:hypothetical protein CPB83DRAFT_840238 [Crepidotus variabilis]|uniref:Uncharacterized protein n=1 Tax=Crepidotus variabilis TaxID=179855 RepID=A0A9P6E570_9AGAR|nr:hypothetical protein CPB83DRAFT_840238 [Crepidotus variabilis]